MTSWKSKAAALLLSMAIAAPGSAQGWFFGEQEPGTYQAMHPDRDVLNGGALTPAGRMGLVRPSGAALVFPPSAHLAPYDQLPRRR
ncbi:hypothetical protein HL667_19745 [Bradyrhizobium sp. 83012]|uniref:Uncharacterized protein n=1 Tax=Bradyrhizobium aeschynomenes TaxID=2734909 RepID=A0ABX2CHP9_9BRAD|nr:hypothetical protein [Bradyrhizobium aeschynomenes]NPU67245.1 hypothetical protein [Bradyrhizobium aeschynomenes]